MSKLDQWPAWAEEGHYWRRTDQERIEEVMRASGDLGVAVLHVEPCYSTLGETGDEWFPVVLGEQPPHLSAGYQQRHKGWPGNNLLVRTSDGWFVRYCC